jgi:hypothetical protein
MPFLSGILSTRLTLKLACQLNVWLIRAGEVNTLLFRGYAALFIHLTKT